MRKDHELQKAVLEQLDFDPAINSSHIGVSVRDGVVTLGGHVPSASDKARAEMGAGMVKDVKAVVDEISVELPGHCETPDELIAQRAYERLTSNNKVPADRIHLSVEDGVVTMRGDVDWEYQRAAALYDLQHLNCVRRIRNEVTIKPAVQGSLISERIHEALERLGLNSSSNIHVETRGSDVDLFGEVTSWQEKRLAENVAWSVPGVSHVANNITVN
jgi:osmotically-inducible protein OsmY